MPVTDSAGWVVDNEGGCRLLLFVSPNTCWFWDLRKNLRLMLSVALLEKQNRGLLFSEVVDHKFNVYTLNILIALFFSPQWLFSTRWKSFHSDDC